MGVGIITGLMVFGVVIGALLFRFWLVPFIGRLEIGCRLTLLRYPDYDRELSNIELAWIDETAHTAFQEVSKAPDMGWKRSTAYLAIGMLVFLAAMVGFGYVVFWIHTALLPPIDSDALSWFRVEEGGVAPILALFLGLFALGLVPAFLCMQSKNIAFQFKYYFGKYHKNTPGHWKTIIRDLVLKRKLKAFEPPDITVIIKAPFQRWCKKWGIAALVLGGTIPIFLVLDLRFQTLIYADHIERSPYFSLVKTSYSLDDIVEVERSCHITVRGKNQRRPTAKLEYILKMSDGQDVPLFGPKEGASLLEKVDGLEYWHKKIPAEKLSPISISSSHAKDMAPTKTRCAQLVFKGQLCKCAPALSRVFDLPSKA